MDFLPKQDKKYLSFLVSDSDIKVVKVREENGKKILDFYLECPIPAGLVVSGEVKDIGKLTQLLSGLKPKLKLDENLVVVGLSEIKATTRSILLPHLAPEEIDQAVKFQVDAILPFSYENEYLDWMFFEAKKNGKMKILVSAIPKNTIDGYVSSFRKAGFLPIAFEPKSLSLLRSISPEERKQSLVIEVAEVMTVLVINKDGDLEMSSVVLEKDQFLSTIERIDEYYFRGRKEKGIELKVFLCGKNISSEFCEQIKKLGAKVILLKTGVQGVPPRKEMELVASLWLAQKQVASPKDIKTINILPSVLDEQYRATSERKIERRFNLLALVILIFLDFVLFLFVFQTRTSTNRLQIRQDEEKISTKIIDRLDEDKGKAQLVNQVLPKVKTFERGILNQLAQ